MQKYHVTTIDSEHDIAIAYAEFIIGVNDGDYTTPNASSDVDKEALMDNFVSKKLHQGDVSLDISMSSVIWYEMNYTSGKNVRRRGVRFICHAGGTDYSGKPVDNDMFCKLWSKAVSKFVENAMEHLEQKRTKIYFHYKHGVVVETIEVL